ncbi:MAG: hypothetical protein HN919_15470 [Verrucomicrobia bacterium]|jgi:acetyltransferase-like isoleucine patch superfamily enzyme|nr:hypothetical protein [Verrucomicrobiota bacterium]MBT7067697.1 hypothetical protein [Verrucomicrobiota bacterium]MBT7701550.1 hypothetical protein [Verrucomicrobiota bacterium]
MRNPITTLEASGVIIPAPSQIHIAADVDLARIGPGTVLHPGTRLSGAQTAIGPNGAIGTEGPVVLRDCQLGAGVTLGSGSAAETTLLDGVQIGPGAHIRPGCLLEEQSACGHTVGLKQTVFMPFMVTGSLINFCDCMMSGGTSRSDHSEVGSSYIHFNYTPHQDKATPSLVGDVPRGVMLDQRPIFLGGQGGLVGPVRIEYGTVIAAGTIYRRDIQESGLLITGSTAAKARPRPYQPGLYGSIARLLCNNLNYIGNLHALREWYRHVRSRFMTDPAATACHAGALLRLDDLIDERVKQLDKLTLRLGESLERAQREHPDGLPERPFALHQQFIAEWPRMKPELCSDAEHSGDEAKKEMFLAGLDTSAAYLEAVSQAGPVVRKQGTEWLQGIVDGMGSCGAPSGR